MSFLCRIFGHKFKSFTNVDTQETTSTCIRCGIRKNVLIISVPKEEEEMKEEEEKVTCDSCGADLTTTEAITKYRLCLSSEDIPMNSEYTCDIYIPNPLKTPKYFCGFDCLKNWIKEN